MSSIPRTGAISVLRLTSRTSLILAVTLASACSADVTRFSYGGGGGTTASIPTESVGGGGMPPRGLGVTEAPLPSLTDAGGNYRVVGREYKTPPGHGPSGGYDRPQVYDRPPAYEPAPAQTLGPPPAERVPYAAAPRQPAPAPASETVEVQPGETLFSIARRNGVTVAALKDANGLSSDSVRPGQRLMIPAGLQPGAFDRTPVAKGPALDPSAPPPLTYDRKAQPKHMAGSGLLPGAEPPPGWEGRYRVKASDSLYGIAFQHRVSLEDLAKANNIVDQAKVVPGTVLAVPELLQPAGAPGAKGPPRIIHVTPKSAAAEPVDPAPAPARLVRRNDIATDAVSGPPPAATTKFRWPVARRNVISSFGKLADGRHNDGINIAAPLGSDIVAAEAGKVAYADSELKGYGKLILIRHANGWVTAYAHADEILVRAKDEVRKGQVIGKVGKTGAVDQPQLHFELRQPTGPVDPIPHLGN